MNLLSYLESKVYSNSCSVVFREELVNISLDQAGLATTKLSNNQDLEDVLSLDSEVSTHDDDEDDDTMISDEDTDTSATLLLTTTDNKDIDLSSANIFTTLSEWSLTPGTTPRPPVDIDVCIVN